MLARLEREGNWRREWPSSASSGIIPNHHENLLLPPHAVSILARRFRADVPVGLGGRAAPPARRREDARSLPGVPRRARVRRGAGLRWAMRERAPQQRLRPDAVA